MQIQFLLIILKKKLIPEGEGVVVDDAENKS